MGQRSVRSVSHLIPIRRAGRLACLHSSGRDRSAFSDRYRQACRGRGCRSWLLLRVVTRRSISAACELIRLLALLLVRLVEAINEGAYLVLAQPDLFHTLSTECRALGTSQARLFGLRVEDKGRFLVGFGFIEHREAVARVLPEIVGVIVVPAVCAPDGKLIVLV